MIRYLVALVAVASLLLQLPQGGITGSSASSTPIAINGSPVNGDNGGSTNTKVLSIGSVAASEAIFVAMNTTDGNCTTIAATVTTGTGTVNAAYATNLGASFGVTGAALITGPSTGTVGVTITPSGGTCAATHFTQGCIARVAGLVASSPVDVTGPNNGSTVTTSPAVTTALTTAQAKEIIFVQGTATGGHTWGNGTDTTFLCNLDANGFNGVSYVIESSIQTSITPSIAWTVGSSSVIATASSYKGN